MRARLVVTREAATQAPWQLRQRALDTFETARAAGVQIVEHYLFAEDQTEFLMDGDAVKMAPAIEVLRAIIDHPKG